MRILITNAYLDDYAGTQVVTRDLAVEFRRMGHEPVVYSPGRGRVAEEIRQQGIAVTDSLETMSAAPDIIHGQCNAALEALARFPEAPGVMVCHGVGDYTSPAFFFPRIFRYAGVDERCVRHLRAAQEIPQARILWTPNAVDLRRFRQRSRLPARPRHAAVFTRDSRAHVPTLRRACRRMRLELEVFGGAGKTIAQPETVLPRFDVVFAKARCALESLATGNAVVLCAGDAGAGAMVSTQNYHELRRKNFGIEALTAAMDTESICEQLQSYDRDDAAAVCERVRAEAGLEQAAQRWIEIYKQVIEESLAMPPDRDAELLAIAKYLARRSYESRMRWEKQQLRRIAAIPVVGRRAARLAQKFAK
jgi:hypothetical protein